MTKQKTAKLDLNGQRQRRRPAQRWGGHAFVRAEVHQEGRGEAGHQ